MATPPPEKSEKSRLGEMRANVLAEVQDSPQQFKHALGDIAHELLNDLRPLIAKARVAIASTQDDHRPFLDFYDTNGNTNPGNAGVTIKTETDASIDAMIRDATSALESGLRLRDTDGAGSVADYGQKSRGFTAPVPDMMDTSQIPTGQSVEPPTPTSVLSPTPMPRTSSAPSPSPQKPVTAGSGGAKDLRVDTKTVAPASNSRHQPDLPAKPCSPPPIRDPMKARRSGSSATHPSQGSNAIKRRNEDDRSTSDRFRNSDLYAQGHTPRSSTGYHPYQRH